MKNFNLEKMNRSFNKLGLKVKKYSPELLLAVGVVGVVTSTVLACKATTKLGSVLEESKNETDQIREYVEKNGYSNKYTEEDKKKDLAIVYTKTAFNVGKLYAPAVVVGVVSITSILASNNILHKRNVALAAAYAAVDKSFKDYRGRVIEKFGKELDRELKYNIKAKEVEEVTINENGEEVIEKRVSNVVDPNMHSEFAVFFDDGCNGWTKDPEFNKAFLIKQQNYANDKLKAKGYLFLNEVYTMLGLPNTRAGQVVGWIYDEKNPIGDNFVDFGIFDIDKDKSRDFVNGYERTILLDFNVDGCILDLI